MGSGRDNGGGDGGGLRLPVTMHLADLAKRSIVLQWQSAVIQHT